MAISPAVENLVVDCGVALKWELSGEADSDRALEMLLDWRSGAIRVHSVDLLASEIGSAFLKVVRQRRATAAEAEASIDNLLGLLYQLHASRPLVSRSFQIALRHEQRVYDCFYVALAEREGFPFWTSDARLYNALHGYFPFIRLLTNYIPCR
jgi:predicted nucleic acid-binding protein